MSERLRPMQTPEEMAREVVEDYDRGDLELCDIADLIRARDAKVREAARAEAWDEGCAAGLREANDQRRGVRNNPALNPYRIEPTP